jgi:hypothetical protein
MDECAAKRSAVPRGLGGSDGRGVRPRGRPRCPDRGARLGASTTRTRASHCRPGGGSLLVSENDRWNRSFVLYRRVTARRSAKTQNSVQHASTLLRFSGARVAALPSARHTPAATMAEQGKQDIVRKLIHIFLDVPHDIFVNFTRSIERGTRHRNAHSVSKNPTPNPRALFPFGPESPSPGAIADGHLPQFRPSTSAHPPAIVAHVVPCPFSLSRENDPDPQSQPPARLRSSSGSPSSASCSWCPSCTKRRRS